MIRARNAASPMTRELTWLALEQFCPCLIGGALVTVVLAPGRTGEPLDAAGPLADLLQPGDLRLVPAASRGRPSGWPSFYLGTGLAVLALAHGEAALSPWAMGLPFGAGQLLAAAVLYRTLERDHASA